MPILILLLFIAPILTMKLLIQWLDTGHLALVNYETWMCIFDLMHFGLLNFALMSIGFPKIGRGAGRVCRVAEDWLNRQSSDFNKEIGE